MNKTKYKLNRADCIQLCLILALALAVRLFIAAYYENFDIDLPFFNIPWALAAREGIFEIYKTAPSLDYPPVFPFLLGLVSKGVEYGVVHNSRVLLMFFIKLVPCLFDVGITAALFFLGMKRSKGCALMLSLSWAMNFSTVLNCACWGQNDSMLLLFVLLMFWALEERRPILAGILFAVGCLVKLQMAYFIVILLLELMFKYPPKIRIKSLSAGLLTGAAGWFPFMIGAKSFTLPFDIYLGGFGKYTYVNLSAFNIYGALLSEQNVILADSAPLWGSLTYNTLSTVLTVIIVACVTAMYIAAKRRKTELSPSLAGLIFICAVFMLTTRMHERYQMPVLVLCLLCFVFSGKRIFYILYMGFMGITFLDQCFFLFDRNRVFLKKAYDIMQGPVIGGMTVTELCIAALAAVFFAVLIVFAFKKLKRPALLICGHGVYAAFLLSVAGDYALKAITLGLSDHDGFLQYGYGFMAVFSVINIVLFMLLAAAGIRELTRKPTHADVSSYERFTD